MGGAILLLLPYALTAWEGRALLLIYFIVYCRLLTLLKLRLLSERYFNKLTNNIPTKEADNVTVTTDIEASDI